MIHQGEKMSGGGKFGFSGYASNNATIGAFASIATSSSGSYDEALTLYRVGNGVNQFETGSNFSSGSAVSTLSAATFVSARDRSIAFGCYTRNGASSPAYSYTLTQTTALPTGLICDDPLAPVAYPRCAYNQIQDNLTVSTPFPTDGYPDQGLGKYIAFSSAPTALDSGTYTLLCVVTDGGSAYATTNTLTATITFT